jgi:hypothetical protein
MSKTAREIGISKATLSRIEAGKHPTYACYLKIARWIQPGGDNVMQMMEVHTLKFKLALAEQERDQVRGFYNEEQDGRHHAIQLIAAFFNAHQHGADFGDDLNRKLLTFLRNDPVLRGWVIDGASPLEGLYGYERMEQALDAIATAAGLFLNAHQSTLDNDTIAAMEEIYRMASGKPGQEATNG